MNVRSSDWCVNQKITRFGFFQECSTIHYVATAYKKMSKCKIQFYVICFFWKFRKWKLVKMNWIILVQISKKFFISLFIKVKKIIIFETVGFISNILKWTKFLIHIRLFSHKIFSQTTTNCFIHLMQNFIINCSWDFFNLWKLSYIFTYDSEKFDSI